MSTHSHSKQSSPSTSTSTATTGPDPTPTTAPVITPAPAIPAVAPDRFKSAFERLATKRAALTDDDLLVINLEIPLVITTIFGLLPGLRALRDKLVAALPGLDVPQFDSLEDTTLALAHAHTELSAASSPAPTDLVGLNTEATALRETLLIDAKPLAHRGYIDATRLAEFKGLTGYRNVAFELLGVAALLRNAWATVFSKTAVEMSELDRASVLADELMNAVGLRDQSPVVVAQASDERVRAYTMCVNTYDEVRSAVLYARRHEDDADTIAPSLYAGRTSKKSTQAAAAGDAAPITPASPGAPTTAASAPTVAQPAAATAQAHAVAPVARPGFPGGSSFTG